jgi:hypothetical protein
LNGNNILTTANFQAGFDGLGATGTTIVVFPVPFIAVPYVTSSYYDTSIITQPLNITSISATQFTITGDVSTDFNYIAYSPTG